MKRPFARLVWMICCAALRNGRSMRRRLETAEHALELARAENASLQVQLTAYRDTVDSLAWERRASMAESKVYAESLRHR